MEVKEVRRWKVQVGSLSQDWTNKGWTWCCFSCWKSEILRAELWCDPGAVQGVVSPSHSGVFFGVMAGQDCPDPVLAHLYKFPPGLSESWKADFRVWVGPAHKDKTFPHRAITTKKWIKFEVVSPLASALDNVISIFKRTAWNSVLHNICSQCSWPEKEINK